MFTVTPAAEVHQIQFVYTKKTGNVALDDVKIMTSAKTTGVHPDFNGVKVGNTTTHTASLSGNHTTAWFFVEALDAEGTASLASNIVAVTDAASSGITTETVDADAPVEYFNLQGMPVANPAAGVYIRRQGSSVTKVLIK